MDHIPSRNKPMPIVNVVITAAKVTGATYRIVATVVMGYYLVKGVADYERQRRKESKNAAFNAYSQATGRSPTRSFRPSIKEARNDSAQRARSNRQQY